MRRVYIIVGVMIVLMAGAVAVWVVSTTSSNDEAVVASTTDTRKGIARYVDPVTGEVDQQAIDDMARRVPSYLYDQALTRAESKIEDAVNSGSLSEDQAVKLEEALKEKLQ